MNKRRGLELRASYHGPLHVRILVWLLVFVVGLAVLAVVGVALRVYV